MGFASAVPITRECEAIGSSKHQLALKLTMLERRTDATVRKALASKGTGRASGTHATTLLNFASLKFFSFSRGAKFGPFRPTATAQVVCGSLVRE
jgi:hypothetical protein